MVIDRIHQGVTQAAQSKKPYMYHLVYPYKGVRTSVHNASSPTMEWSNKPTLLQSQSAPQSKCGPVLQLGNPGGKSHLSAVVLESSVGGG